MKRKYYVVWVGRQPGIYDTWEECQAQTEGYPGAKFKAFPSCEDATEAFRKVADAEEMQFYKILSKHNTPAINYSAYPEILQNAIAVDGACDKNPGGNVEYQGIVVGTGERVFHVGPLPGGSNNIGEFLGLVHALALLYNKGDGATPIYSDSRTALSWVRHRRHKSTVQMEPGCKLAQMLERANAWLATHQWTNPIYKWNTEEWGEIPADFGRK